MPLHIGKIIKEISKYMGVSQAELARKINTTRQNIQSIYHRQTIDTRMLQILCEALEHDFFQYHRYHLNITDNKADAITDDIDGMIKLLELCNDRFLRVKKQIIKLKKI
ncbi:MAG: hypothetical protein RIR12_2356 [Bacteroidota bacterium]|jgi:transcriptional regulator with XRE-family HTH domain